MECNPEQKNRYPIEKETELLNQIANADIQGAKKTLNEILGSVFFSSGNDFEIIKSRVLELVVLLSRAALKGGGCRYRSLWRTPRPGAAVRGPPRGDTPEPPL